MVGAVREPPLPSIADVRPNGRFPNRPYDLVCSFGGGVGRSVSESNPQSFHASKTVNSLPVHRRPILGSHRLWSGPPILFEPFYKTEQLYFRSIVSTTSIQRASGRFLREEWRRADRI